MLQDTNHPSGQGNARDYRVKPVCIHKLAVELLHDVRKEHIADAASASDREAPLAKHLPTNAEVNCTTGSAKSTQHDVLPTRHQGHASPCKSATLESALAGC